MPQGQRSDIAARAEPAREADSIVGVESQGVEGAADMSTHAIIQDSR